MAESMGFILDEWSALVMDKGALAQSIDQASMRYIQSRGLQNTSVYRDTVTKDFGSLGAQYRPAIVAQQKLGRGGLTHVALSVAQKGNFDLEVAWFVCAKNDLNQITGNALGVLGLLVGAAVTITGLLVSLMGFPTRDIGTGLGISMLSGSEVGDKSYPTAGNIQAALELAHTVDYCLMQALGDHGIDASQLRVTHPSSRLKIGQLGGG